MKQEVVEIDDLRIVITEIKVKTARKVMANVIEVFQGDVDVEALINDKYDILVDIANDFVIMPEGSSIDDLAYSDIKERLWPAFQKVNQSFLDDLMTFAPDLEKVPEEENLQTNPLSEDSTKP